MTIGVLKIKGFRDAVMLRMEKNPSLAQLTPRQVEIRSIRTESEMAHCKNVTIGSRLRFWAIDREQCDGSATGSYHGRVTSPGILVAPFQSEHLFVPGHRALDILDSQSDVVDALKGEHASLCLRVTGNRGEDLAHFSAATSFNRGSALLADNSRSPDFKPSVGPLYFISGLRWDNFSRDLDLRHSAEQISDFVSIEFRERGNAVQVPDQTDFEAMERLESDGPRRSAQESMVASEAQLHDVRRRPILFKERGEDRAEHITRVDRLQLARTTPTEILGDAETILDRAGNPTIRLQRKGRLNRQIVRESA
jgi:hypothetical protein